jgi:hypothetical protein
MSKVVLDAAAVGKLMQVHSVVAIEDANGNVIGHFVPEQFSLEPQISPEELDRREREETGKGRKLKDILADLEKRS